MVYSNSGCINIFDFDKVVKKLRAFFDSKDFIEVHTQNRLSILAACEDPKTIATYDYSDQVWPLPQTGQMWLEYEMLKNPEINGCYCVSTSYRNEPNPVPGRHDKIFPMFEFEMKGDMEDMKKMEIELLDHLGFNKFYKDSKYPEGDYVDIAEKYGTKELEELKEKKLSPDSILKEKTPGTLSPDKLPIALGDNVTELFVATSISAKVSVMASLGS